MTEVDFDLDAFVAESLGEPFVFKFGGEEFTVAPAPDMRIIAEFDGGSMMVCLQLMLGDDYERFAAIPTKTAILTRDGLLKLLTQWTKHQRASLGESSASTGSSKSTGRPSKRTSNGSTESR